MTIDYKVVAIEWLGIQLIKWDTHSKKDFPSYVSCIIHRNSEPLAPVSKPSPLDLFSILFDCVSQPRGSKDVKLDRTALKVSPEILGRAVDCKAAKESNEIRKIGRLGYIAQSPTPYR